MKVFFYSVLFTLLCAKTTAQEGQTYSFDFKNPIDAKQIKIVSADNFDVVYVNINDLDFTNAPFIAASVRIEGQHLDENLVLNIHSNDKNNNRLDYVNIHRFHENEEDPTQLFVSELAFLDKNIHHIQVAIRIEKPALDKVNKIQIRLFNPTNLPPAKSTSFAPEGACDLPPSVSRAVWGASWGLTNNVQYKSTPTYSTVTHLIVHHSAGGNTSTNWAATVASIFDFHVNSNGWSDVGYNYLIAPDGTLFVGRGGGNNVVGAHYCAKNNNTMGVCMLGTYTSVAPTDTAWATLEKIFAWKAVESNINPATSAPLSNLGSIPVVNGHRSGCATECPGDSTFNRLPALRTRLAAITTACRAVSTKDLNEIDEVHISPNPVSNGTITLTAQLHSAQNVGIKAFNTLGQEIMRAQIGENVSVFSKDLDVSHLPKGIYFFYINAGKSFTTQKVVIE